MIINVLLPVIGGVIATAFGFVLVMLWDMYKERKSTNRLRISAEEEMKQNLQVLGRNNDIIETNSEAIKDDQHGIIPMATLRTTSLWLYLVNARRDGKKDSLLDEVSMAHHEIEMTNTTIIDRESSRIHHEGMSGYNKRLGKLDAHLKQEFGKLYKRIALLQVHLCIMPWWQIAWFHLIGKKENCLKVGDKQIQKIKKKLQLE